MVSATLNVLRWSVFGAGIAYGFAHNSSLASEASRQQAASEYAKKEALIAQAKAKYAELHGKKDKNPGEVVTDISDPKFDVEKYIDYALKE